MGAIVVVIALLSMYSVHADPVTAVKSNVTVDEGNDATLLWKIAPTSGGMALVSYVVRLESKRMVIVTGDKNSVTVSSNGRNEFGDRLTATKDGYALTLVIKNATNNYQFTVFAIYDVTIERASIKLVVEVHADPVTAVKSKVTVDKGNDGILQWRIAATSDGMSLVNFNVRFKKSKDHLVIVTGDQNIAIVNQMGKDEFGDRLIATKDGDTLTLGIKNAKNNYQFLAVATYHFTIEKASIELVVEDPVTKKEVNYYQYSTYVLVVVCVALVTVILVVLILLKLGKITVKFNRKGKGVGRNIKCDHQQDNSMIEDPNKKKNDAIKIHNNTTFSTYAQLTAITEQDTSNYQSLTSANSVAAKENHNCTSYEVPALC